MAGSRTIRTYTGDNGVAYQFAVDESNAKMKPTGSAQELCPVRINDLDDLPKGLLKRYVLAYNKANPLERRKFTVGSTVALDTILTAVSKTLTGEDYPGPGDTAGTAQTWVVTFYRGEQRRFYPSFDATDTGLTDGTTGQ